MDELRTLYQETILEHSRRPRNFGKPAWANRSARGYNPLCGDQVTVYVAFDAQGHRIERAGFEGKGCAICLASASMMTEAVAGQPEAAAQELFGEVHRLCTEADYIPPEGDERLESLMSLSGVRNYPARVKCATLAWHALRAALEGKVETTTE